jgi:3-deoxy-7-phosphoheptulonate synthase
MVWGSIEATKGLISGRPRGARALIILLSLDAGPAERSAVAEALASLGVTVEEIRLGGRIAFVRTGGAELPAESLQRIPHVESVVPLSPRAPMALATRQHGARAVPVGAVPLGEALFGGGNVGVIAGPCTVEEPAALRDIARTVRAAGAAALRGGVFKVRTSPHAYQGGGLPALREIAATAREVGLPFFTEIADPRQVAEVAEVADGLQIGARHMQNFPLLTEAGRTGKPVLLKRHMAADVDEWLLAAEYVLKTGNERVILCERGLKSSERHVRYLLDVGVVPWLKQRVGLPVIVDPSHSAGDWRLVPALARAAIAAGADGLIVEVHPRPETTRCDAAQALPPADFEQLMHDVRVLAGMDGRRVHAPAPVSPLEPAPAPAAAPARGRKVGA